MNPKLPLDGRIYTLTLGSVLTTNVSQINLCQLLFRATLKVLTTNVSQINHQCISNQSVPAFVQSYSESQARLMFVTTLGMDNFDCTKMNAHFKKFTACLREGLIHEWKQALLAPPLPLMSLNNSRFCSTRNSSGAFLCTAAYYQRYIAHSS